MKQNINIKHKLHHLNLFYKIPFCVETSLLNQNESLPLLSYVTLNQILYPQKRYFTLPSRKLKSIFGRNYIRGVNELKYLKYIERKVICSLSGWYFSIKENLATSYKLESNLLKSVKSHKFKFIAVSIKYKLPLPKNGRYCLEIPSKNPKVLKLLKSYSGITVDSSWLEYFKTSELYPDTHPKYPNEPIAQHGVFIHTKCIVESVLNKRIGISSESKSGRAFHPLIRITRGVRKYFRKNGQPLVNIDAKSFHPYLIASCIEDINDRHRYLDIVRGGFYEIFVDESHSREMIKVALQKYLSGRPTKDSKVLEIGRWYEENFPDVPLKMMELKSKRKKFQMYLQQLEASIFVDDVFIKSDFWNLPAHDGLCVLEKDKTAAIELINKACENRLGYRIPLESH